MPEASANEFPHQPQGATGVLVLNDGTIFWGKGLGATGSKVGEVVFNTSLTGYQEVLTDPSYAAQIITFTFPHIGNVGTNPEDMESTTPAARGCVLRMDITDPANWRATQHLNDWLRSNDFVGIAGVDTRRLTARIRDGGAPTGVIAHAADGKFDLDALLAQAKAWSGLEGMDLAKEVTCRQTYSWTETQWSLSTGFGDIEAGGRSPDHHVVAIDFGAKRNILRCLADTGCKVTVVPATATAEEILGHEPDGIFLSNGPGDPAATGTYAVKTVQTLLESGKPMFGICLGHQILALALGAKTYKLKLGHRGGNQPVQDLETGKVEITSQNHGFCVDRDSLPAGVIETHRSLFDGIVEGLRVEGKPVFSVQYHPEASPGPQDSYYLFERFVDLIQTAKTSKSETA
ncbi:MAG: glutamine-hydrolyzing carbamoyl-phosphate synthase small subunit [Rhodospirillaceae bacterium]|jgi:carbamoyl-phosphate synthase small subunit|nr:glutamine-hydrolyzing carbamoyl-phosphate synthase small subunit [Rhodospirillaceae bacterium]MBT5239244.1 glutamine-hydrolyzing carbamoyl-phosphate synthase small subunit [Rhodospirillaceae bacterium]MBT5566152.1 glutamine-hydrolyzing carbamoyl-phosphate synthase small subunit [Rhodospirillaceae bacterium]MBT6090591.1 glutamine-hydrolyzing carbamoyl-phosphate synthase small subunit [Rhodospirillaceae bacterium]MBT6961593.1 glutamine-hydrolyzing carbamoyl-phosphate synthase small subunit [Rh